ncbi:MAG TPA: hypothetical protein VGR95_07940 [Thermoanaerobaculia bacterium]|jgi:hypothetical protein|nr:hypothetical protein [Thermoanaerobaculia bacterium]
MRKVLALLGFAMAFAPVIGSAQTVAQAVSIEKLNLSAGTGVLRKVIARGDRVYVLDAQNHHVLVVKNGSTVTIGGIGNGPADLYQPFDLAVDSQSRIYVQDHGNKRISIFDDKGTSLGGFPDTPKSLGLAVTRTGEVLLGQPQLGSLISAYDKSGHRIRSFGALVRPSEIYGPSYKRFDANVAMFNRVRIATDDDGNIWAAFAYMPLVCKFSPAGQLLMRKKLEYPELAQVIASVGVQPPSDAFASMNMDGVQLTMVTRDIEYEPHSRRVLVLLGNERTLVLDNAGRDVSGFRPAKFVGNLQNVWMRESGEVLFTVYASPAVYHAAVIR